MLVKLIIILCCMYVGVGLEEHDNGTVNEQTQEKAIAGDTVDTTTTFVPAKGDNHSLAIANRDSCSTPAENEGIEYLQSWTHVLDPQKLDILSADDILFIYSVVNVNRNIVKYDKYLIVVIVHRESKKGATLSRDITLSILERFAKFFHCCKEQ